MIFKWKKRYYRTIERLELIRKSNAELYTLNISLSNIMDNLKTILETEKFIITDLYCCNDIFYYIVEQRLLFSSSNYEVFYHTYNLSNIGLKPICKLEARVNIGDNITSIRLDNIDTMYESRLGHGSRQVQKLIKYARDIRAIQIRGELYINTPIGLDNLKRFYIKNGFEVTDKNFIMKFN